MFECLICKSILSIWLGLELNTVARFEYWVVTASIFSRIVTLFIIIYNFGVILTVFFSNVKFIYQFVHIILSYYFIYLMFFFNVKFIYQVVHIILSYSFIYLIIDYILTILNQAKGINSSNGGIVSINFTGKWNWFHP